MDKLKRIIAYAPKDKTNGLWEDWISRSKRDCLIHLYLKNPNWEKEGIKVVRIEIKEIFNNL